MQWLVLSCRGRCFRVVAGILWLEGVTIIEMDTLDRSYWDCMQDSSSQINAKMVICGYNHTHDGTWL